MLAAFAGGTDVDLAGRLWRYQASGLGGTPGQVVEAAGQYSINLGGGAGFSTD
jgi:hypothetical protein